MNILFLTRSLEYGGAERQLTELACGLRQRGHEVSVAVFYPGGGLERELSARQVPVISLGKQGRWDIVRFLLRLNRVVREQRPDVIHSYVCNLVTMGIRRWSPGMKIVWGVRCSYIDFSRYDWVFRACDALAEWASRWADLIIANSQAGRRRHVERGYPAEKTIVIPNGIDTVRFHRDPGARRRIRAEWAVRPEEEVVGLVGRLDPMKDHATFLRAASLLARERPGVRFMCVGAGSPDDWAVLQRRTADGPDAARVCWVGPRADMERVYNALDLLVNCSYGEGFSNVLGEAMACGVPCVATDVGDSAQIVGAVGEVVPPRDAHALKEAMRRVLDRNVAPADVRRRIVKHYSVDRLIRATERELLALCGTALASSGARRGLPPYAACASPRLKGG